MNLLGLHPIQAKVAKYNSYKKDKDTEYFDNLIKRDFKANLPNEKWTTDITEFKLPGITQKLYLAPVLDMCTKEIVSFRMSTSPSANLVYDAVFEAIEKNKNDIRPGMIFHSDRGFQNFHHSLINLLKENNIKQSMSRKGNCNDNGIMESFFGLLKTEMFYDREDTFKNLVHLASEIESYIYFYNNFRIKIGLNGMSPVQFKKQLILNIL